MRRRFFLAGAITSWAISIARAFDWEAIGDELAQIADRVDGWFNTIHIEWSNQIADDLQEHALVLLKAAEEALQDLSEEELAELEPWLRLAADHAMELRELAPYAGWLRARLDYFAAARQVMALAPITSPLRPPEVSRPPWRRPRTAPRRPPPPPSIRVHRAKLESARHLWRKRAAAAPPPPSDVAHIVPVIRQSFQAERVPAEFIWIAQVESSFDPRARSPRGAVGLFQLMPATAKSLGLQLEPKDEREDPARSAQAAARLLRRMYGQFGSWPLALAAYNAGEGRVSAALRTSKGRSFEDIAPALPVETRMYVPRVLEMIRVREGVDPDRLPSPG